MFVVCRVLAGAVLAPQCWQCYTQHQQVLGVLVSSGRITACTSAAAKLHYSDSCLSVMASLSLDAALLLFSECRICAKAAVHIGCTLLTDKISMHLKHHRLDLTCMTDASLQPLCDVCPLVCTYTVQCCDAEVVTSLPWLSLPWNQLQLISSQCRADCAG
jgi:hypothetical protein